MSKITSYSALLVLSVIVLLFCLSATTSQAQDPHLKIGVQSSYLPHFAVREAMDDNVRPIGIRVSISDYNRMPVEFGAHIFANYGDVAVASFGFNLAYVFARGNVHFLKGGLSLSKIDLENVKKTKELGPNVGDVSFADYGTEFKPYLEWEWMFSRFSSLFVQTGYRIINGERSVVTEVEGSGLDSRVTGRDDNFFYSASGFDFGVGLSINL